MIKNIGKHNSYVTSLSLLIENVLVVVDDNNIDINNNNNINILTNSAKQTLTRNKNTAMSVITTTTTAINIQNQTTLLPTKKNLFLISGSIDGTLCFIQVLIQIQC